MYKRQLISLVAERLSNSLEDLYICRYSGSIFAAVLEDVESIEEDVYKRQL